MSRKKNIKTKRETWFYGITDGEVNSISATYDPLTDSISFGQIDKTTTKVVTHYTTSTGKEKIIHSIPCYDGFASVNPTRDLLNKYYLIFSIDTNTFFLNNTRLSVTCVYKLDKLQNVIYMNHFYSFCIINVQESVNPEIIAWYIFLNNLAGTLNTGIVALITDSELGKHEKFNSRIECYYKNYILPNYIKLVYGSSDKKNDGLPNAMVYMCDNASRMIADKYKKDNFKPPHVINGDENFDGYFVILSTSDKQGKTIEFNI
jgi:hypothetical protein